MLQGSADNDGVNPLATNTLSSARTKHIDVRFCFIRELVRSKTLSVECVPTKKQRAGIFTKALVGADSKAHRGFLMNLHVRVPSEFSSVILIASLHELILLFSVESLLCLRHTEKTLSSRIAIAICVSMAGVSDNGRLFFRGNWVLRDLLFFGFHLVFILEA